MRFVAFLFFGALLSSLAIAAERRSSVRGEFQRHHPCPATGERRGACPGHVLDHVRPLCAGGLDHVANLQWQTVAEGKRKDRIEARECAAYRRKHAAPF